MEMISLLIGSAVGMLITMLISKNGAEMRSDIHALKLFNCESESKMESHKDDMRDIQRKFISLEEAVFQLRKLREKNDR
jgi:hypothetical protein